MSTTDMHSKPSPPPYSGDEEKLTHDRAHGPTQAGDLKNETSNGHGVSTGAETAGGEPEDILALQDLDPALNMKMHLVNNVRTAYTAYFPSPPPSEIL